LSLPLSPFPNPNLNPIRIWWFSFLGASIVQGSFTGVYLAPRWCSPRCVDCARFVHRCSGVYSAPRWSSSVPRWCSLDRVVACRHACLRHYLWSPPSEDSSAGMLPCLDIYIFVLYSSSSLALLLSCPVVRLSLLPPLSAPRLRTIASGASA
jgi:hypothetical protein